MIFSPAFWCTSSSVSYPHFIIQYRYTSSGEERKTKISGGWSSAYFIRFKNLEMRLSHAIDTL